MPPPTEQGFQRENMGGFERIREVAMPPPTEQGFQPKEPGGYRARSCRNAPSNRTRISTHRWGGNSLRRMSQCLLQQNKDFNPISPTRPNHRDVAMPPPTEQGFQRENMGGFERIREVAMPPPTEQGFQRDIGPAPHTPNIVAMPPPTEQGFQPHYQGRLYREVPRRNAPSNRTRIST